MAKTRFLLLLVRFVLGSVTLLWCAVVMAQEEEPGGSGLIGYLQQLWPTEEDLSYQYLVFLLGEAVTTLTGIGTADGTTLSTIALTSIGTIFIALAGVYIVWRTIKGIFIGAHREHWIGDYRSSLSIIGPVVGFLLVIPIPAINGMCIAHTLPLYTGVTGIGIGNLATEAVLDAYGEHPLVALSGRKFIDPVAYQSALTMLSAHVCIEVINQNEGVQLQRFEETLQREDNDLAGTPGVIPGLCTHCPGMRKYDALVAAASAKYGVPPALIHAIIQHESSYNPNATSPKGAMGLMQLMPATARRFGVTDAYDPAQNIMGGTAYLAWLLNRYNGDVRLAAAAYNAGEGAVDKYGGIPPYQETQTYVKRVMASYGKNQADGIPGGIGGTMHVRRVMWGGPPYEKNLCGELEYPYAYTMTKQEPVAEMTDSLYTTRDFTIQALEQKMADIARRLVNQTASQDALSEAMLAAIMDFDFRLHRAQLDAFAQYSEPAMTDFIESVKIEGWSTLGAYFMKLAELQEAIGAGAGAGIVPKMASSPDVYLTEKTGLFLKSHLTRMDALVQRAHRGFTEAERLELARTIAQQNRLGELEQEINQYVHASAPIGTLANLFPDHLQTVQLSHPNSAEYFNARVRGGMSPTQGTLNSLLDLIATGSDRFPLLKYQEIGKAVLGAGAASKGAGFILSLFDASKQGVVGALAAKFGAAANFIGALLLALGYIFAIFLPLLPLLVWFVAVLNWFLNLIVAMIAAPIWGLFHINLPRAKTGFFVMLRLLLYPAFLVMSLILVAGLLMVGDAIIDKTLVTSLIKLARGEEYVMAVGVLILYMVTISWMCIRVTRLMVTLIDYFYLLVDANAGAAIALQYDELVQRFKKPGRK